MVVWTFWRGNGVSVYSKDCMVVLLTLCNEVFVGTKMPRGREGILSCSMAYFVGIYGWNKLLW